MAIDPRLNLNAEGKPGQLQNALEALGLPVNDTMIEQISFFTEAMLLFEKRGAKYGDAWKKYGYHDCLFHMRSKLSRTTAVLEKMEPGDQTELDDAIDLLNYTVFALRCALDDNARGV